MNKDVTVRPSDILAKIPSEVLKKSEIATLFYKFATDRKIPCEKMNPYIACIEEKHEIFAVASLFEMSENQLNEIAVETEMSRGVTQALMKEYRAFKLRKGSESAVNVGGQKKATKFKHMECWIFWQADYSLTRQYLVNKVGKSEKEADAHGDLPQTENDRENAIKMAVRMGVPRENIKIFTGAQFKGARDLKKEVMMPASKRFGQYKSEEEGKPDTFLMVYCAGHGASEDDQYFILNTLDDVAFNMENCLRTLAHTQSVSVMAFYDICRSKLSSLKARGTKEPEDDEYNKQYNYCHLGTAPGQTVAADSKLAEWVKTHMDTKAQKNKNRLVQIPHAFVDIGHGIQQTSQCMGEGYFLEWTD